jgi:hypothetical protein
MLVPRDTTRYSNAFFITARRDTLVYAVVALYLVLGAFYVIGHRDMLMGAFDIYAHTCFITYCLILPFVVLICGIARITHRLERRRRLAYRYMFGPRRVGRFLAGTLLMMAALLPFQSMFASIKSTIDDFAYDKFLADLDKAIHFGQAPVKYLYNFAESEWMLRIIEFNYNVVWFILCFGLLYWVAISPRADRIRQRFLATAFLAWVLIGNVVAGLVPTAGPAFYGLVTGDLRRFDKVRAFVETTAGSFSSAADEQHYLWLLHASNSAGLGSGISALPSMHVATIAINALFIAEYSRKLALAAWAYVTFIMVSSVYLGWHYAIDGYVALALSIGIYWAVRAVSPQVAWLIAHTAAPRSSSGVGIETAS